MSDEEMTPQQWDEWRVQWAIPEINKLRAERDSLRAALERIAVVPLEGGGNAARSIARQALTSSEKEKAR